MSRVILDFTQSLHRNDARVAGTLEKEIAHNLEQVAATVGDLIEFDVVEAAIGLLDHVVDIGEIEAADMPAQPAAQLGLVRDDLGDDPAVTRARSHRSDDERGRKNTT